MPEQSPRRRADVALALLVMLATLAVCVALILSQTGLTSLLAFVVTLCSRTLNETFAHGADIGRLFLLFPLGLGVALAAVEAARLLFSTQKWIGSLLPARCPPPPRLRRLAQKCHLNNRVVLVRTDRLLVFTHGLLTPQIWLSTGILRALTDDELEAVLRHEAHHLDALDPLKILATRSLSRALFFVPIARDLSDVYALSKEIAADRQAVRAMGNALPLARTLRKLIAAEPAPAPSAAWVAGARMTEERLLALLDPVRPFPAFQMKHLGLSLLWLLIFTVVAVAPVGGHAPTLAKCFS